MPRQGGRETLRDRCAGNDRQNAISSGAGPSSTLAAGVASDSDEDFDEGVVGAGARAEFKYVTGNFSPQSVEGRRQPVDLRTPP